MLLSTFWHVLAENILLVALGQTIAFCEANLLGAKALFPKVNLLLAKALLQKAALLDWSAPGLRLSRFASGHCGRQCWYFLGFSWCSPISPGFRTNMLHFSITHCSRHFIFLLAYSFHVIIHLIHG